METDVLIVGAGPTGLMLANQLMRRGTRIVIVDRNPGPSVKTKALGVQARTLEIYSHLGLAEQAIELGTRAIGAHMWVDGHHAAHVPLGDIGQGMSPYPYLLILGQDDNERLLGKRLAEQGGSVCWNTTLVGIREMPGGAAAQLKQGDGTTLEVAAQWIAGCDGAHSTVRGLCGIDFVGAPYEDLFFVADTRVTGSMRPGELNVYLWRGGFHLFFPMRGADHWRVVGIVPDALRSWEAFEFDAVEPFVRKEVGAALTFHECSWFSTYHVHHRRAARFWDGRCFLLGDAAHIHSPVGAQGMNTGLQDGYNLAWKLALITSGRARTGLLESYQAERLPVAERLLKTTDRAFTFFVSDRWPAEVFRERIFPKVLALAMSRASTRRLAFRTISQIGIRYPGSPLSASTTDSNDGPAAGDRFPWMHLRFNEGGPLEDLFDKLDDRSFNLLLFGQPPPAEAGHEAATSILRRHAIPDDPDNARAVAGAQVPTPSYFLLRPDGHVGLAGREFDPSAVTNYLRERIGLLPATAGVGPQEGMLQGGA